MANRPTQKVSIMKESLRMILNMVKEFKLLSKDVNTRNQDKILMSRKIVMQVILSLDTNKVKELNILSMDNMKVNGMKVSNMVKVQSNTKRVTHTKVNGSITANMEKVLTFNQLWSMANKNSINTQDNLKKASIMEKESWNIGMVINMMVNGPLVKKKVKECMNGPTETIMMVTGKKILHKVLGLLVLVVSFMMVNFTQVSNTVLEKRLMIKATLSKLCGKMVRSLKNQKLMVKLSRKKINELNFI